MGTRNLTCVFSDGEFKIAQYGQWDGYPSGAGRDICEFILGPKNIEALKEALNSCHLMSDQEYKAWHDENIVPITKGQEFIDMSISQSLYTKFPQMDRDLGSSVLYSVIKWHNDNLKIPLKSSLSFATDSLFCEWAYIVNLDEEKLEIYKGFNKLSVVEQEFNKFSHLSTDEDSEYQTVSFLCSIPFDKITDNSPVKEVRLFCPPEV